MEFYLKPFIKCIALKIDMFQTDVVDEQNFDPNDVFGIREFRKKYRSSQYRLVEIDM